LFNSIVCILEVESFFAKRANGAIGCTAERIWATRTFTGAAGGKGSTRTRFARAYTCTAFAIFIVQCIRRTRLEATVIRRDINTIAIPANISFIELYFGWNLPASQVLQTLERFTSW